MELQNGGDVSRSWTGTGSNRPVITSGSAATDVGATLGAGMSTIGEGTAGACMQQVGVAVFAGTVLGGQQL
jgi:hypothetical protein